LDYGDQHQCVLPIVGIYNDSLNNVFKGSCILIDPFFILTAAHVVNNSLIQYVIYDNKEYECIEVVIHEDWISGKMGSHDIAICKLKKSIELNFYPELYDKKDEKHKICSLAGYGFTGTFATGYDRSTFDNRRRAGSNTIDSNENFILVTSIDGGTKTNLEFLIACGDSGGGLFIDQKLAGIHSFIIAEDKNSNSDYGDIACHTRISQYIPWINKIKSKIK
jgi:hypothetical protein